MREALEKLQSVQDKVKLLAFLIDGHVSNEVNKARDPDAIDQLIASKNWDALEKAQQKRIVTEFVQQVVSRGSKGYRFGQVLEEIEHLVVPFGQLFQSAEEQKQSYRALFDEIVPCCESLKKFVDSELTTIEKMPPTVLQKLQRVQSLTSCLFYGQPTKTADGSYTITYAADGFTAVPRTACG